MNAVFRTIGHSNEGNALVEMSGQLRDDLAKLAFALIGGTDRPRRFQDGVDLSDDMSGALAMFLAEAVREVGQGPNSTIPSIVITKIIKPGGSV